MAAVNPFNDVCPICMMDWDTFPDGSCQCDHETTLMVSILACGHQFHDCCLGNFTTCPMCRFPVFIQEILPADFAFHCEVIDDTSDSDAESPLLEYTQFYQRYDDDVGTCYYNEADMLDMFIASSSEAAGWLPYQDPVSGKIWWCNELRKQWFWSK